MPTSNTGENPPPCFDDMPDLVLSLIMRNLEAEDRRNLRQASSSVYRMCAGPDAERGLLGTLQIIYVEVGYTPPPSTQQERIACPVHTLQFSANSNSAHPYDPFYMLFLEFFKRHVHAFDHIIITREQGVDSTEMDSFLQVHLFPSLCKILTAAHWAGSIDFSHVFRSVAFAFYHDDDAVLSEIRTFHSQIYQLLSNCPRIDFSLTTTPDLYLDSHAVLGAVRELKTSPLLPFEVDNFSPKPSQTFPHLTSLSMTLQRFQSADEFYDSECFSFLATTFPALERLSLDYMSYDSPLGLEALVPAHSLPLTLRSLTIDNVLSRSLVPYASQIADHCPLLETLSIEVLIDDFNNRKLFPTSRMRFPALKHFIFTAQEIFLKLVERTESQTPEEAFEVIRKEPVSPHIYAFFHALDAPLLTDVTLNLEPTERPLDCTFTLDLERCFGADSDSIARTMLPALASITVNVEGSLMSVDGGGVDLPRYVVRGDLRCMGPRLKSVEVNVHLTDRNAEISCRADFPAYDLLQAGDTDPATPSVDLSHLLLPDNIAVYKRLRHEWRFEGPTFGINYETESEEEGEGEYPAEETEIPYTFMPAVLFEFLACDYRACLSPGQQKYVWGAHKYVPPKSLYGLLW